MVVAERRSSTDPFPSNLDRIRWASAVAAYAAAAAVDFVVVIVVVVAVAVASAAFGAGEVLQG